MIFSLIILGVVVAMVYSFVAQRNQQRQLETKRAAEIETALATSRRAADEDVTRFGEELQALDAQVAGHPLDTAMRQDYERALDAYDNAKTSLAAVQRPEEIRNVTEVLEDGRYAIACVNARIEGRPLPQKRPPCFFNPAHGPSTENVLWTPPGGTERDVPACAADAERVRAGADPYIRTVQVGSQRVPYWQGGPAYAPWAQGYYTGWSGSSMLGDILLTSMIWHGMGSLMYGAGGVFDGIGGGFGDPFGGVGDGLGDAFGGIGDGIGDAFGGIGSGLDQIGDGIGDAFGDIGNFFDF